MSLSVHPRNLLFSGKYGNSLTVTSVMKQSAPSLPMTMWRMSGPAARRGTFLMRQISPPGKTASSPTTMSSMPPYKVENWPMLRVATRPPRCATGLDCGEWPVVSPCSRTRSSSACSGTPHSTVACMLYGSTSMILFIVDPSMITESGTALSRPPSVAVPPVLGMTVTSLNAAQVRMPATCSAFFGSATAAGTGIVCTSKMFCSLRKLSTLLSTRTRSSVTTASGPTTPRRPSTMASLLSDMSSSFACRGRSGPHWKMENDCSRMGSVASWMVR